MSTSASEPEALFLEVVERFGTDPSVTPPSGGSGFGANGLKVGAKLFAFLSKGELVVKLPRQRVEELVASGTGDPFDPGHGRIMKEWIWVGPAHSDEWPELAREARQFVGG
jgi:hypothetical protein